MPKKAKPKQKILMRAEESHMWDTARIDFKDGKYILTLQPINEYEDEEMRLSAESPEKLVDLCLKEQIDLPPIIIDYNIKDWKEIDKRFYQRYRDVYKRELNPEVNLRNMLSGLQANPKKR